MSLYQNQENLFLNVSFDRPMEGIVLDNTGFYNTGRVKIYLPTLFLGLPDDIDLISTELVQESLINTNLDLDPTVKTSNYLECYPFVLNGLPLGSMMPDIGDTVTVFFPNGDTKLPYYINGYRLKEVKEEDVSKVPSLYDDYSAYGYYRIMKVKNPPMTGRDVFTVGKKLSLLGYDVQMVDDEYQYNKQMETAVRAFQTLTNITVDGKVGPLTYTVLMRRKLKPTTPDSP